MHKGQSSRLCTFVRPRRRASVQKVYRRHTCVACLWYCCRDPGMTGLLRLATAACSGCHPFSVHGFPILFSVGSLINPFDLARTARRQGWSAPIGRHSIPPTIITVLVLSRRSSPVCKKERRVDQDPAIYGVDSAGCMLHVFPPSSVHAV